MARQKVSLAFLKEGEDRQLIGVFSCLKNALNKVAESDILIEKIQDQEYHLEVYSMYNNEWLDFDEMELEFSSFDSEDRKKLTQE